MAYSVAFKTTCYSERCGKPAKHKVFNRWNGEVGQYCLNCANRRVTELNLSERINDGHVHPREAGRRE